MLCNTQVLKILGEQRTTKNKQSNPSLNVTGLKPIVINLSMVF